jgi:hypothetical protein
MAKWVFAVALALTPAAAAGVVPTTQTCKPLNLPLTFVLPADWACQGPEPYGDVAQGAKAGGIAPGFVLQLNIFATDIQAPSEISSYESHLAASVRKQYSRLQNVRVVHSLTTVGASIPAVLIEVRSGGSPVRLDYFFVHGDSLIEFDYGGAAKWVHKNMTAIKASAKSIHFVITA